MNLKNLRKALNAGREIWYRSRAQGRNMKEINEKVDQINFRDSSDAIVVVRLAGHNEGFRVTAMSNLYIK